MFSLRFNVEWLFGTEYSLGLVTDYACDFGHLDDQYNQPHDSRHCVDNDLWLDYVRQAQRDINKDNYQLWNAAVGKAFIKTSKNRYHNDDAYLKSVDDLVFTENASGDCLCHESRFNELLDQNEDTVSQSKGNI